MASAFTLRIDEQDRVEFTLFNPTDPSVSALTCVLDRADAEVFFGEGMRLLHEPRP